MSLFRLMCRISSVSGLLRRSDMSRTYSDKFLRELSATQQKTLGHRLGELCVEARLPAAYVAAALGSSRMSVYSWFRGKGIRENKRQVVEAFIRLVHKDMEAGILPVKSSSHAKAYIEEMIGSTI